MHIYPGSRINSLTAILMVIVIVLLRWQDFKTRLASVIF